MIHNIHSAHKLKTSDKLLQQLQELTKETVAGKVNWEILCSTTEYNDEKEKQTKEIDGKTVTIDECFVSYFTRYFGNDFLMITYEQIENVGEEKQSLNLVFMPPLGIRYFDINALAPYAVEADQVLTYHIHQLWLNILERKKNGGEEIALEVEARK